MTDLTDAEADAELAEHDPLAAMAVAYKEQLDALLHDVQSGEAAVQEMLAELGIRAGVIPPQDPNDLWKGMPEFEQEDAYGHQSIIMHFANAEDVQAFARLIGQAVTDKTTWLWYPKQEPEYPYMVKDES